MVSTALKSKIFLSFLIVLFLLVFPKTSFGLTYYPPGSDPSYPASQAPTCYYDGGSDFKDLTGNQLDDCTTYGGKVKENICYQNPWRFQYAASCRVQLGFAPGDCQFVDYQYQYNNCDTSDRCYGATTGASGYDGAGRVIPGICSASSYDGVNPESACVSGGWYKQCCSSPGAVLPTTYCSNGVCPAGEITTAGIRNCNAAPPVTCSLSSRTPNPYTQCGGTCNGVTYPDNHTIEVTESTCTDNTTQYSCSDLGALAEQCGNPSTQLPSCSVSWTFSNTNPLSNTPVNVTVNNGSSNFGWNSSAYSLDGGAWVGVSAPPVSFSVSSDSAGLHSLQFSAVSSGSRIVCGNQNSQTFITQ